MKKVILLIIIITSFSCVSQKENQTSEILEVVFDAHTRGAIENISVIDNAVTYKNYSTTKTFTLEQNQKEHLLNLIQKLDLKFISELQAPSNNRASDAALHASLIIKTTNEVFTSSEFDHDNPPDELKSIVDLLHDFVK
ncbi:hypothetical protein [Tenacibaculum jejuense]|uniref:Probable lipoprotein n=1 Tax=Tenacibaculum jejuense TaxID=584609 RepID=A0A238UE75_9FLAO|nr:hypothetical protein [Tenacibaculum jejuense]SNR17489.1 Probable lipoprotein precursor [Tenacibaculum jejuense]